MLRLILFCLTCGGWAQSASAPDELPSRIEHHSAVKIELYAKEPDVVDPVGLCFDAGGRMYVVEMRDYPYGLGGDQRPGGTVRLLEDRDGDGRADSSSLFAAELSFPTSIAAWNGGVLVTAPPEILFLKDTTGDGRADVREVWFRGFTLGVTDGNVNGLRWGLDNRIHGVNGGHGGVVEAVHSPGRGMRLGNLDFSFDPRSGEIETTFATGGGFGLVFDEWGRSFTTHNIDHVQLRVLPVRYLQRGRGFPPVDSTHSISDHGAMARIYPVSVAQTRPNHPEQAGHFSAAGGMGYIGHKAYAGDLYGSVLVCDVVGNLVHRDVLHPDGPVFVARRSPDEIEGEFIASHDIHFRPVGLESGPDGALYLLDMQREVIEHPDYIPARMRDQLDLRAGEGRGRIYRIIAQGNGQRLMPRLDQMSVEALTEELGSSNSWRRNVAQRLLVERQDRSIVTALRRLTATTDNPLARLHALWTLHGLQSLDEALVIAALADPHPALRENALQLAEHFLPGSRELRKAIVARATDESVRVRFQGALTLGELEEVETTGGLRGILERDYEHRWSRLAVLSSLVSGERDWLGYVIGSNGFDGQAAIELIGELADLAGARCVAEDAVAWAQFFGSVTVMRLPEDRMLAILRGWQSGLNRAGVQWGDAALLQSALEALAGTGTLPVKTEVWRTQRLLGMGESESQQQAVAAAINVALDRSLPITRRSAAARLCSLGRTELVVGALLPLLSTAEPIEVQEAVFDTLQQFSELSVAEGLIQRWRFTSPSLRPRAVAVLLQRRPYHGLVLDAIEDGRLRLGELNLDLEQRRRLLRWSTPDVQARAARLIGDGEYGNRQGNVDDWLKKLPEHGNPAKGRALFELACASCHRVGELGHEVGPDLTGLSHRSVEDLLSHVLDPNMAIEPAYVAYDVETAEGEIMTGILENEGADSIALLMASSVRHAIPRERIVRMESTGLSLMAEGLEEGMTPQDLRDLIAFLQERR